MNKSGFLNKSDLILQECDLALHQIDPDSIESLVREITAAEKVFCVGVGRVLIALQSMVKRLNHLGIAAYYVGQIDEPPITDKDLLIVGSSSGESLIPVAIARKAQRFNARIAYVGSNSESTVSQMSDLFVRIPVPTKIAVADTIESQQPMSSLFEQCLFLLGDVLALMIMEEKQMGKEEIRQFHANLE